MTLRVSNGNLNLHTYATVVTVVIVVTLVTVGTVVTVVTVVTKKIFHFLKIILLS